MKFRYMLILAIVFTACGQNAGVNEVIAQAGKNAPELEKVMMHYQDSGENEKLQAARFLISNMKDKFSYCGKTVTNFDALFAIADSLHRKKVLISNTSPYFQHKWDSLATLYGPPATDDADELKDAQQVKASYLIEHIDYAFKAWKEHPWGSKLSFSQFCQYLLPYRIGNEILEPWLKQQYLKYSTFRDTIHARTSLDYAKAINKLLKPTIITNHTMWAYPFDLPASKVEKAGLGACRHLVYYTAMAMRANGLPVGVDMTPTWGNRDKGHLWNTLLTENGRIIPFDAAKGTVEGHNMFVYKFAKAYRLSYTAQKIKQPDNEADVPASLIDAYRTDVTHEYTRAFDIDVPLTLPVPQTKKYALICTFGDGEWVAQDWGPINDRKAHFRNMGSGILYRIMYTGSEQYLPASEPFVLTGTGAIRYFSHTDGPRQQMTLYRKYGTYEPLLVNWRRVLGGRLQGANKADFSDSVNLFTITKVPEKLEEAAINTTSKFRYIRYIAALKKPASIAELEIYTADKTGKLKKLSGEIIGDPHTSTEFPLARAFDGDLSTYFYGTGTTSDYAWVGLDLGKPQRISKIRYCPQNDTNFIIVGNEYELFYWDNNNWKSSGKQVAKDQLLKFSNVPANRLYLLHNLTGGKEERIFTYENGKQVWW